jgi:transcriptional regulator with XRE-family HTH domain
MSRKELSKKQTKNLEAIGLYLRELRLNENLTRDDVCFSTKIGKPTLLRIEKKCQNYGIIHLLKLSEFFNVPASEIISIID